MTIAWATFVTYLWHYLVARLLYDNLLRPLADGGGGVIVLAVGCLGLGALLVWRTARKRSR